MLVQMLNYFATLYTSLPMMKLGKNTTRKKFLYLNIVFINLINGRRLREHTIRWTDCIDGCLQKWSQQCCSLLLEHYQLYHNIEVNVKDSFGMTLFMRACTNGHKDVVKITSVKIKDWFDCKKYVRLCFIQNSSPKYHEIHHYAYYWCHHWHTWQIPKFAHLYKSIERCCLLEWPSTILHPHLWQCNL